MVNTKIDSFGYCNRTQTTKSNLWNYFYLYIHILTHVLTQYTNILCQAFNIETEIWFVADVENFLRVI